MEGLLRQREFIEKGKPFQNGFAESLVDKVKKSFLTGMFLILLKKSGKHGLNTFNFLTHNVHIKVLGAGRQRMSNNLLLILYLYMYGNRCYITLA